MNNTWASSGVVRAAHEEKYPLTPIDAKGYGKSETACIQQPFRGKPLFVPALTSRIYGRRSRIASRNRLDLYGYVPDLTIGHLIS
jgi:hypothetical protein